MAKTSHAVDTLDRLAVQLQGIQEAAKQLREIGSVEGAVEALTVQRDALSKDLNKMETRLAELHGLIGEAAKAAKVTTDQAETEARQRLATATHEGDEIIVKATDQAASILAKERETREETLSAVNANIGEAKKKLQKLEASTVEAEHEATAVEARAMAAQDALDKIQAQAKALSGAAA
jgi:chromosome segregation ATPase